MTRTEAKQALLEGKRVTHEYYSKREWLEYKDGILITEDGYKHGGFNGEFWTKYQIWPDGWYTLN